MRQYVPSAAAYIAPPPAIPVVPQFSRRMVLIGAGGLVVAAGTAGVAMTTVRNSGAVVATGTPSVTTPVAAAAAPQATATATSAPTATRAPPTATASPVAPIIITAPPIIITATPSPTAIPTPTPLPTATPIPLPTATAEPPPTPLPAPTATPIPLPTATRLPPPTPTVTPHPLTAAPAQPQQVTWTDPQGRMQMAYPTSWRVVPLSGQNEIFEVESGDGVDFSVYASPAHDNDPMNGITAYRDRQNRRTDRSYSFNTPISGRIGGLNSVYMDFTSASRQNASDVHTAEVDYVINSGWEFAFEFYTQGTAWRRQDDLRAMLRSVTFSP